MAETLPNGTVIPHGADLINENGVQAMRNLGGSVDGQLGNRYTKAQADALLAGKAAASHTHPIGGVTGLQAALNGKTDTTDPRLSDARTPTAHTHELGDVTGLKSGLDGKRPLAPVELAAGSSLDDVAEPGPAFAPTFSVASTIAGKPSWATANPFTVDTWQGSGGSSPVIYQRFTQGDAFGLREALRYRFGGVWQEWRDQLPDIPDYQPWYRGSIPSSAHLDDLETGGYYAFSAAAENVLGLPAGTPGGPVTIIRQGASGGHFVFHTATSPMQTWSAHRTGSGWTTPAQFAPGGDTPPPPVVDAGLTNHLLVGDYTRRLGGTKWTTTGVVALRFDHGLAKFDQHIRPHLERLNLPYSLALNSQNWGEAENVGVTPQMVNGWVEDGLAEVWNHGQTHIGSKDQEVWTEIIVAGRDELRAQIPAASVDGFVIPGTGGVGYGDFITGASLDEFSNTPAGQLLLATHAVVTGSIPNSGNHILDGRIRNGHNHTGFGSSTLSSFQSAVTSVGSQGYGRVFMMHPSQIETAGYDTEAMFAEKLDWLAAERDAGNVKVVGHYEIPAYVLAP